MLLIAIFAPMAAVLLRMGISRTREYMADRAAQLTGDPEGLAQALERISGGIRRQPINRRCTQRALLRQWVWWRIRSWFSTHPPIDERVKPCAPMLPVVDESPRFVAGNSLKCVEISTQFEIDRTVAAARNGGEFQMLKSGLRLAALVCVVLCCMGPATMQAKGSDATTTETARPCRVEVVRAL